MYFFFFKPPFILLLFSFCNLEAPDFFQELGTQVRQRTKFLTGAIPIEGGSNSFEETFFETYCSCKGFHSSLLCCFKAFSTLVHKCLIFV